MSGVGMGKIASEGVGEWEGGGDAAERGDETSDLNVQCKKRDEDDTE